MSGEEKKRTIELANRLQDMTNAEWSRLKRTIDALFREKERRSALEIQLCETTEENFLYG